jgi:hypothetical protein
MKSYKRSRNMAKKGDRQLNYELLRIIAMLMIVCLHYLGKGGALGDPARENMTATGYLAWLIEAFCLVAVNVYVLISGYFGVESKSKKAATERVFKIWKQVFFYSFVIGVIALVSGIQKFDIYVIIKYIFPIITEHYWFATSYIVLCLFMPFINSGFDCLDKKEIRSVIALFLCLFCISKTIIPIQLPWDKYGYDVIWFVILYMTGAYIGRYGLGVLSKKAVSLGVYILNALVIFAGFVVIRMIFLKTGKLEDLINYGYTYNYLFCYIGAIGLFGAFARKDNTTSRLERFRKPIELFSSATFGVYLIHEHVNIRYLWPVWFKCSEATDASVVVFLLHMIGTVAVVYVVCSAVEILRAWLARQLKISKR